MSAAEILDDMPRAYGARLQEERERAHLKPFELAHLAGITDYLQTRFENGTSVIPIDYLHAIAVRSELDVLYIITGERSR